MTFQELKDAGFVLHHRCGACNSPVGYEVHKELAAACFQSGCDCGGTYPNYRVVTHEELAAIPSQEKPHDLRAQLSTAQAQVQTAWKARDDALVEAANAGFVPCYETRHVTLGDKVRTAILALRTPSPDKEPTP